MFSVFFFSFSNYFYFIFFFFIAGNEQEEDRQKELEQQNGYMAIACSFMQSGKNMEQLCAQYSLEDPLTILLLSSNSKSGKYFDEKITLMMEHKKIY